MASTSSSSANTIRYDVFLSFRGEDTRDNITDHLYEALVRASLATFRDNDEIGRGQELKPEIDAAIKASEASIIVFSKNFANSTWCLDELSLIMEQRRERNLFVLPVFYHVDPSDVRKQTNSFFIKEEIATNTRWTVDNVKRWKIALTNAANLTGLVLSGSETKFVKDIVDIMYNKVTSKKFHLPLNLVKMDTRYDEINSWIKQSDGNFFVVCGMGGSGKTTLARYTVYSNRDKFEHTVIVENIGSKWKEQHHLLELQETLLGGILGVNKGKVLSKSQGEDMIKETLRKNKALIVLDDIVSHAQLKELLGEGININKESKIIVTTRTSDISKWVRLTYKRCRDYEMRLLDDSEALELFSLHAFGSKDPIEDFKELSQQVVWYCKGNPLALEVLGSSLSHDISIPYWKSEIDKLEKNIHSGIQKVLMRSYTSLPYEDEKKLFLHIACFFNGEEVDYVVKILERDCSAVSSIKTLTKRCLLSISPNQRIMMHPLLQEMGRLIVTQESVDDPAKRSRVWQSGESHDLLRKGTGSRRVQGLALDNQKLKEENHQFQNSELKTDSFKGMCNLKLLYLKSVQLSGSYEHFSKDLIWMRWIGFQLHTIPSDLFMGKLVALDMSDSCLQVFEPPMDLLSLKILNFKDSHMLEKVLNINKIPNLETLILWNCEKLVYVCETIGGLKSLALLNMTGCENLCKSSFPIPCSLERIFLTDCKIEYTDNFNLRFSGQSSMQYLNLVNNLFEFLPIGIHLGIGNLRVLDLTMCSKLKELLSLPKTLAELYINYCVSLEKVTFESHRFALQKLEYEGCTSLSEIEGFIKLVPVAKFDESDLGHLKWLKDYQDNEMRLVGVDELTRGKSQCLQVLYEFGIVSTSLPDVKIPNMTPECILGRTSTSLLFTVPEHQGNRRLKGLNVTFKYTLKDDDSAWFAKISTSRGVATVVDLMYNPTVSGRPTCGRVGIWLSYWPIGNKLHVNDQIKLSIVVVKGLEVRECDASLVYDDVEVADETSGWVETLDKDLSAFQLRKGGYYLCRHDFFDKVETGKPTPLWFQNLVDSHIDHAVVQGWGKTGGLKQSHPSHGLESKGGGTTVEMSRSSFVDKDMWVTSSVAGEATNSETASELSDAPSEESEALLSFHHTRQPLQKLRAPRKAYDVFLSIGAEDTHNAFTDHLYDALARAGIRFYRPADRGEELEPEVVKAIQNSTSSVVVFSEKYANSILCLDELLLIWEQKRDYNQFVLPIFYHVEPTDVRDQTNRLKVEVKSSTGWTKDKVDKWKGALKEVSNLKGMKALSGSEAKFVQVVVDTVYYNCRSLYRTPNLTGISVQLKEIKFWLEKTEAEVLAIHGMKGSGKTTLAHYIFNLLLPNFELISFLEDIDGRCSEMSDLCKLQESLLGDILDDRQIKVESVDDGRRRLEEVMQSKTTLIVLDNVVDEVQLKSLLGTGNLNKHSKIIITSGDARIKTWIGSRSWRCKEHKMKLLNDSNALELFSLHAFRSKTPKEGYKEVAKEVLRYCKGHPLALKVWGSVVSSHALAHSEIAMAFLETQVTSKLYDVLVTSFNSLPDDMVKELFLDIACFFTGEAMDYVAKILGHVDINTLINKHLVSVSSKGKLEMHPLHQEMGRKNVDRKSVDPLERSRVWRDKESYQLLREGKGSKKIKGLALDIKTLSREKEFQSSKLTTDALKKMENLELLQFKYVQLAGSFRSFSQRLRLLCWHGFHLSSIPSNLYMGNIVAIDMSYSKLEVFEPPTKLQSLEILNLKESHNLQAVRKISRLPNLETLILSYCNKLEYLCETLGNLTKLTLLNVTKCEMLFKGSKKQASFSLPRSLQQLFLKDCNPEITNYFPPSYSHLDDLRVLDLTRCSNFKHLPSLPTSLAELYINYCELLEKVTFQSHRFMLQEFGCEGCSNLSEIEGIIRLEPVAELEGSDLGHMKWLKEYQDHQIYLMGNNELTAARCRPVQMLYEFGIRSTSLPDTKDPNMTQYTSGSSSLEFIVPPHLDNRRIKGLDVIMNYTVSSPNPIWFVKISTNKGVNFMYNPTVFGKPGSKETGVWFSYWPIGNRLAIGDEVTVSIIMMSGLEVIELGASLVYEYVRDDTVENSMRWEWEETVAGGGDLSRYELSTGAYYLCRRDLFKSTEVHRANPEWFRKLDGDTVDETELQGWKINGRPSTQSNSLTIYRGVN